MCEVIKEIRGELQKKLEFIDNLSNFSPKWTKPSPLKARIPKKGPSGSKPGVYRIIYKPTGEVMSVGQGTKVSARKACHTMVFLNNGSSLTHRGGYVTDSPVARKMYEHDQDIENWYFSFVTFAETWMAQLYEKYLQNKIIPDFNDLTFAGK